MHPFTMFECEFNHKIRAHMPSFREEFIMSSERSDSMELQFSSVNSTTHFVRRFRHST
jgi:hypothetical protein